MVNDGLAKVPCPARLGCESGSRLSENCGELAPYILHYLTDIKGAASFRHNRKRAKMSKNAASSLKILYF